jgi:hypothetical protein
MHAVAQGLVTTNYWLRAAAFFYCFVVVGVLLWERGAGALAWALAALQFLAYPHVVYWRARVSAPPQGSTTSTSTPRCSAAGARRSASRPGWCSASSAPPRSTLR